MKALENELLGGGVPEVERIEISSEASVTEASTGTLEDAELSQEDFVQAKARQELEASTASLKERVAKYSEMVADVKVSPKSTMTRVEARRRQRQMEADWDSQILNELDKLRREFTKALFRK